MNYLLASTLHENAAKLQATRAFLEGAGKDVTNIKVDADFAWRNARAAWNKYLDHYLFSPQSVPKRLVEIQQRWNAGDLESTFYLWDSCHLDVHSTIEARLRLSECETAPSRLSSALQDLLADLARLSKKRLAQEAERIPGKVCANSVAAQRLELLARLGASGEHPLAERNGKSADGEREMNMIQRAVLALSILFSATAHAFDDPQPVIPHRQDKPPNEPYEAKEAVKRMVVPEGFTAELVAAEPDIVNPIAMSFDDRGRIWITESVEYPRKSAGLGRSFSGTIFGIAVFDHPDNPNHPTGWRADQQGLINPAISLLNDWSLKAGKERTFKYGILVYQGPGQTQFLELEHDAYTESSSLLPAVTRLQDMFEAILDLLVRLVDLLVGQRAVVGLVGQGVGQALGARGDAVAAIEVEQADAAQQVAAGGADLRQRYARPGSLRPRPRRRRAARPGSAAPACTGTRAGDQRLQRLEVELADQHRPARPGRSASRRLGVQTRRSRRSPCPRLETAPRPGCR